MARITTELSQAQVKDMEEHDVKNSSPSCEFTINSDVPMKEECSVTDSCHGNRHHHSHKTSVHCKLHFDQEKAKKHGLKVKKMASTLSRSGLLDVALDIGRLTRESRDLQREINATLQDIWRFQNCLENNRRGRAIRTFGSAI